ncbi:MAG: NAD+ synthase, partial [Gammaproteobacteria bacterium]|nr:NAD+ synthase [Gammaproteobacteria bacterium]NIR97730.1 NAD+ synthase [Gammaproteobacteria bacterium]NIT63308.1 NAD+ synthase [Gammaproteobacteria bacterium]NIV20669.1 NAD+ synthase [Gammaproteobacteria bacterium]NIX11380.1 NAD+ synthase [Gammaproteobacteria bacterium]
DELGGLFNAASLIREGGIVATVHKQHLPNYSVFDEKRYFVPGREPCVVEVRGARIGITICEDLWVPGPIQQTAEAGAQVIVNINASPYHVNKRVEREHVLRERAV